MKMNTVRFIDQGYKLISVSLGISRILIDLSTSSSVDDDQREAFSLLGGSLQNAATDFQIFLEEFDKGQS